MSEETLITVEKEGERLEIHPTTLKSHEAVGWKIVKIEEPAAEMEVPPVKKAPAEKKPAEKKPAEKKADAQEDPKSE